MKTDMRTMMLIRWEVIAMENTEKWVEKYKETMDKNKPSEKLMEQTLELMKHEIDSQRKGKKKC